MGAAASTTPRRMRIALALALCAAAAIPAGALGWLWLRRLPERHILAMLQSNDAEQRKHGAWATSDRRILRAAEFMASQLDQDREEVADVRESYVYALGRCGFQEFFAAVEQRTWNEPSGFVRAQAWVAAARLDGARFKALLAAAPPRDDAWDRLGMAIGRLEVGDMSALGDILPIARDGTPDQRAFACQALDRSLTPLLEAAGRWPIDAPLDPIEPWPAQRIDEAAARLANLDIQAVADSTRPRLVAAQPVRRIVRRLTNARGRIADLIY